MLHEAHLRSLLRSRLLRLLLCRLLFSRLFSRLRLRLRELLCRSLRSRERSRSRERDRPMLPIEQDNSADKPDVQRRALSSDSAPSHHITARKFQSAACAGQWAAGIMLGPSPRYVTLMFGMAPFAYIASDTVSWNQGERCEVGIAGSLPWRGTAGHRQRGMRAT